MARLPFKTEKLMAVRFEHFLFLIRNLDIVDQLIGRPLHLEKAGEEGYEGRVLSFRFKVKLIESDTDSTRKAYTFKYSLETHSAVLMLRANSDIVISGQQENDKTRVVLTIATETKGLTALALRIARPRLENLKETLFEGLEQAAGMLTDQYEHAVRMLSDDQRHRLSEQFRDEQMTAGPASPAAELALLSIIQSDGKSIVRFSTAVPRPRKSRHDVSVNAEARQEFTDHFGQLARLGSHFVRGKREEREVMGKEIYDKMVVLGKRLYSTYVSPEIHAYFTSLLDSRTRVHLGIETEGGDAELPWELLHNGEDFVALLMPVSRIAVERTSPRLSQKVQSVLILAPNPYGDLPETLKEAEAIYEELRQIPGFHVKALIGPEATKENFLRELEHGKYQAIHYSGHSEYHKDSPRSSCLILHDERKLRADELNRLAKESELSFVFLNSCFSAVGSRERMDVSGLADAFVKNGVPCVLGMRWEVNDKGARIFAGDFYQELQKTADFTESLRKARLSVGAALDWEDPVWAAPIMYTI